MLLKAGSRRLRAGVAVLALAAVLAYVPGLPAGASGPPGAPPAASGSPSIVADSTVPPLPTVPLDLTDGQPVEALYQMALSLSSADITSGKLVGQIAATQRALDSASVRASQATTAEAAAETRAEEATQKAADASASYASLDRALKRAALLMYTTGSGNLTVNVNAGTRLAYAADYANSTLTPGGVLSARRRDAKLRKAELDAARAAQQQAAREAKAASDAVASEQTEEASLESQLATVMSSSGPQLVAEHTALAGQAGRELLSATGLEFTPPSALPPPVPTTAVALGWAFSELGKAYVWGATGPDTFDCSGLTQYVWHEAGVDIPRVAADQDSWTVPVPLSELLPGDLVFFGASDIHHVGIYIGDGLMINAPHTGDVVRVSPIWWSDLAGFGRVHDASTPVPVHVPPTSVKPSPPAVVPAAGAVPSQTQPPPGWQPGPGQSAPIDVGGPPTTTPSSTTIPTSRTTVPSTSTTASVSTTTAPITTTTTTG